MSIIKQFHIFIISETFEFLQVLQMLRVYNNFHD